MREGDWIKGGEGIGLREGGGEGRGGWIEGGWIEGGGGG